MKLITLIILIFTCIVSPIFAEPTRNLAITIHDDSNSQAKDNIYRISNYTGDAVWLPIAFLGKTCILNMFLRSDDSSHSKRFDISIQDPSVVIPGGGSSAGSMAYVFSSSFPYTDKPFSVYAGDGVIISAEFTENKN
jgi:hypothetical protein